MRRCIGILIALSILELALAACSLRTDVVKQPSKALPAPTATASARYIRAELDKHLDKSGFRLLTRNTNALMSRIALTDHSKRSIDLQYYIFNNDATGRLVAQRLLSAADRGVRVRMLLDDINVGDTIDLLDALDAHPNIEVRLFNPFNTRNPSLLSKMTQFLFDAQRLNHRMHNKSFIVDNMVAVVGGRNIGDDYFDASSETNFSDLDVVAIGPVVQEASRAFDTYWNCDAAYPVTAFRGKHAGHPELAQLRTELAHHARAFAESDYAQATLDELPSGPSADLPGAWFWGSAMLVADQPEVVDSDRYEPALRIGPQIKSMIDQARQGVLLISPYFVPGESGTRYFTALAARGVAVNVLTNSLASTDEPAAFSGYSRYRRRLLEGGVQLHELRPAANASQPATVGGTSSGVSLHAKAIVVDRQLVFIGSMNMDQRSKLLNTEMGVIVDCAPLAQAVQQFFDTATLPANAYQVELVRSGRASRARKMQWQASDDGRTVIHDHDPGATRKRRLEVRFLQLLPIEEML